MDKRTHRRCGAIIRQLRAFDTEGAVESARSNHRCRSTPIVDIGTKDFGVEGRELIHELVKMSGAKSGIMPGAGVDRTNAKQPVEATGVREIHAARSTEYRRN